MLYMCALIFMAFGFQQTQGMNISDIRSVRCINNTDQTVSVFDANGTQLFIAKHSSLTAPLYAPGNVVWMVPSAPRQTMYETHIVKKTSTIIFSQTASGTIIADAQLNLFNWLVLRTKLFARSTTSGLTFGILPCYGDDQLQNADQEFSDNCFKCGAALTAATIAAMLLTYQMRQ